jgi:hypothetical protein
MGLLITPSGTRIPFCKPNYTHEYCQPSSKKSSKKTQRTHRTTAEAAADLIRELPLPEEAREDRQACSGVRQMFPSVRI